MNLLAVGIDYCYLDRRSQIVVIAVVRGEDSVDFLDFSNQDAY